MTMKEPTTAAVPDIRHDAPNVQLVDFGTVLADFCRRHRLTHRRLRQEAHINNQVLTRMKSGQRPT